MIEMYDVVVIGGGPGGLAAGIYAAMEGASTVILDRKKEIGRPVRCAEGTFFEVISDLNLSKKWVVNTMNEAIVYLPKDKKISVKTSLEGMSIDRVVFEKELAMKAIKYGAELMLNKNVIRIDGEDVILADGSRLRAKVIIIADGVESKIARYVGVRTKLRPEDLGVCAQYTMVDVDVGRHTAEFYLRNDIVPRGYAWVFSRGDEANVGVITLGSVRRRAIEILKDFVEKRCPRARAVRFTAGCVPLSLPINRYVVKNFMLVGDAARFSNAAGGGGIHTALLSGKIAGEIAGKVANRNLDMSALEEYRTIWRKYHRRLIRNYYLKQKATTGRDEDIIRLFRKLSPGIVLLKLGPLSRLFLKWWWG